MSATTIKLKTKTRDRLKNIGKKDETYDVILNHLLDIKEFGENQ